MSEKMKLETFVPVTSPSSHDPGGPYGDAMGGLNLAGGKAKRPELNGALLFLEIGTVLLVVNGVAYGYPSWEVLMKLHDNYPFGEAHVQVMGDWANIVVGNRRTVNVAKDIKNYFTKVLNFDFIEYGQHWTNNARLVYFKNGPLAIYDHHGPGGKPLLYGVPSKLAAVVHKLAEHKAVEIPKAEFESYPMPSILELPKR